MSNWKRLLAGLLLTVAIAFSQGNTGTITGTVTDPTGAAVPGADVKVVSVGTDATVSTTTTERGEYAIPSVLAGSYRISVTKAGFKTETRTGVEVNAGVTVSINVK